jgi:two-component sensor histidine kinase
MRQYFNWKTSLAIAALLIVSASLYYTSQLASQLAAQERTKVEQLVAGIKILTNAKSDQDLSFASMFVEENTTIPLIITDGHDSILDYKNIDTSRASNVTALIKEKLAAYKEMHGGIPSTFGSGTNYIYYGESNILTQLHYFPYVQLAVIFIFLLVVLFALSTAHRSLQNQVWVGLSKETAHQLGTPLSSIEAWLELLKDSEANNDAVIEMQKDLDRLKLVADRFSKVGSAPQLNEENLVPRLEEIVAYMQRRAPNKVFITLATNEQDIPVNISGPLFDWVMENLLRNALDAMAGKGNIDVSVTNTPQQVWIDVHDDGKGIPAYQVKKVFAPGFTTKKRGWGLGLSLSRRIIERYHHGSIFVKSSEVGKGTTFRIILRR